uniref:Solute carrier organic anion transporter family member n=1 Tax=Saccoglossus kowalevskii TaxID=10224 RepID=A0ABM0GJ88_SACKO|nr:PREDICTED: solute carrier organic anion transporter family member 4C1-like [Saccoglossus kowalevskii]
MAETGVTRRDSDGNEDDNVDNRDIENDHRGSVSSEISKTDTELNSFLCGWCSLRPTWMQRFRTSNWLAGILSSLMFVQGFAIIGIVYMSLSSIEIRFGLSSLAIGIIVATYDLTVTLLIVFVSYFGATRNKPRVLGIGAVIMGCGSLTWAIPHFTTGLYDYDAAYGDEDTLCVPGRNTSQIISDCKEEEWGDLSYYFFVFVFAQVLHGIGASPIYTVGFAFADENASHRRSAWYLAIMSTCSVFGPTLGFLVGSYFLTIYVDPLYQDDLTIDNSDPSWVGAWWIGFLLAWILAWMVAAPTGAFPPELPGTKHIQHERQSQAHHNDDTELLNTRSSFGEGWKDMWPATKMLFKNPFYCCIVVYKTALTFIVYGFLPFIVKFIENQFGLTASEAGLLLAATSMPGAAGGTLLGGWVIKKFNLKVIGTTRFCIFATIVTMCLFPIFLLQCPEQQIAGVVTSYNSSDTSDLDEVNLNHPCNSVCGCAGTETFDPVCGTNNLLYFDACYAGCLDTPDGGETYYNCSCISSDAGSVDSPEAVSGKCEVECWQLPVFAVGFFIILLLAFLILTPSTILTMRCVPDQQRSHALGISSIICRCLGAIPGPILIGAAIDSSCLVWQEVCGDTGTCWIYDNHTFGLKFVVIGTVVAGIGLIGCIVALLVYKPPPEEIINDQIDSTSTNPVSTMANETTSAIKKETSTASLLGSSLIMSNTEMTRKDCDENEDANGVNRPIDKSTDGSVSSKISNIDIDTESLLCGWFSLRPLWIQRFSTPNWLAGIMSSLTFVHGFAIIGIVYMSLSSIEIRFGLKHGYRHHRGHV